MTVIVDGSFTVPARAAQLAAPSARLNTPGSILPSEDRCHSPGLTLPAALTTLPPFTTLPAFAETGRGVTGSRALVVPFRQTTSADRTKRARTMRAGWQFKLCNQFRI